MPKLSIGEKAHRVLKFVMGLRTPGAIQALAKYGFTDADLRVGVERLHVVTSMRLRPGKVNEQPKLLAALDAFESEWFVVTRATLKHAQPAMADWLFDHLPSTRGSDVVVAVQTFVDRLAALEAGTSPFGEAGTAARALVAARGLTPELIAETESVLQRTKAFVLDNDTVEASEREASEAALWAWYLEWSSIARLAIKERHILRALGFRKNQRADDDEAEDAEREPQGAVPTPAAAPAPPALSLPASGTHEANNGSSSEAA